MQKQKTIVSWKETSPSDKGSHSIHVFNSPAQAKDFIVRNLEEEIRDLQDAEEYRDDIKDTHRYQSLFSLKDGSTEFEIGNITYDIAWHSEPDDYAVSDEELLKTLEAFCNTGRGRSGYEKAAELLTTEMHRHCQNELYKFVAVLLRAMATCRFDDRNVLMHNRAEMITGFMKEFNL